MLHHTGRTDRELGGGAVGLLCGSHPALPHWDKRHSHHPGKISPGRPCQNWGQRSTIALKRAPSAFISQTTTKVGGALARSRGEKTKICISSMAMPRSLGQNVGGETWQPVLPQTLQGFQCNLGTRSTDSPRVCLLTMNQAEQEHCFL